MKRENVSLEQLAEYVQRDLTKFEDEGFPLVEGTAPVAEYLLTHNVCVDIRIEGMNPKQERVENPCFRVEATPRPGASRVSPEESDLRLVVYDSRKGRAYENPVLNIPPRIVCAEVSYDKNRVVPVLSVVVMGDDLSMSPGYQDMTGELNLFRAD